MKYLITETCIRLKTTLHRQCVAYLVFKTVNTSKRYGISQVSHLEITKKKK